MKKFILGFVTSAMLFGSIGTYAATTSKIDVVWNVKAIKFDGVVKNSSNKPFVYNGATYVPLRFVAESLNKEVVWDKATQSVLVNTPKPKGTYLGDTVKYMNYQEDFRWNGAMLVYNGKEIFNDDLVFESTIKDNVGNAYKNYLALHINDYDSNSSNLIEFPLNSKYNQFTTKVGLYEGYQNTTAQVLVEFLVDGNVVKALEFQAGDFPEDVIIDVKNGKKLTIRLATDEDSTSMVFGNPLLK